MKIRIFKVASLLFFALVFFVAFSSKPVQAQVSRIAQVFITNWPSLFNTREQNIDSGGNIKVAQQGSLNVIVGNSSPIPVVVQPAVSSTPSPTLAPEIQNLEYIINCVNSPGDGEILLNAKAQEGWELVNTTTTGSTQYCFYMKRQPQ